MKKYMFQYEIYDNFITVTIKRIVVIFKNYIIEKELDCNLLR